MRLVIVVLCSFLASAETARFEVASIHPTVRDKGVGKTASLNTSPTTLSIRALPLHTILSKAYGVAEYQIAGPEWLKQELFDINAKTDQPVTAEDEMLALLQPLLAERFHLTLHRETKTLPAYALTVAKGGVKMQPADPDAVPLSLKKAEKESGSRIHAQRLTTSELAAILSRRMGYPVRDTTGLEGSYKVQLEWKADDKVQNPMKDKPTKDSAGARLNDPPSIFTAVQQQLGLKLEQRKGPVELLVIDHIERTPTGN